MHGEYVANAVACAVVVKEKQNGLSNKKIFEKAGYDNDFFSVDVRDGVVKRILTEYNSEEGLRVPQKPKYARTIAKKKHRETDIKELEARVDKLEKMIEFLKKLNLWTNMGENHS